MQTCHEQRTGRSFVTHVVENHGVIVSIPAPAPGAPYRHPDGPSQTTVTSSSVTSPSTMRKERKETGPSSLPHSAVETST